MIVEAVRECGLEEGERMVVEGEELVRGRGELWVVAGLETGGDRERMEGGGRGGAGDDCEGEDWGEGVGEGVDFIADRSVRSRSAAIFCSPFLCPFPRLHST